MDCASYIHGHSSDPNDTHKATHIHAHEHECTHDELGTLHRHTFARAQIGHLVHRSSCSDHGVCHRTDVLNSSSCSDHGACHRSDVLHSCSDHGVCHRSDVLNNCHLVHRSSCSDHGVCHRRDVRYDRVSMPHDRHYLRIRGDLGLCNSHRDEAHGEQSHSIDDAQPGGPLRRSALLSGRNYLSDAVVWHWQRQRRSAEKFIIFT